MADQLEPDGQDDGRVFVDIERLRELPGKIDTAVLDAAAIAVRIAELQDAGADLGVGEYSTPPSLTSGLVTDPKRDGLVRIAVQAPDMSAEIGRRITYFESAEEAAGDGFTIDRTVWLEDAAPFDRQRVWAAVRDIQDLVADAFAEPSSDVLRTVRDRLAALSPAERQAVMGELGVTTLNQLGEELSRVENVLSLVAHDERQVVESLQSLLLSSAPSSVVPDVLRAMPYLQPDFADVGAVQKNGAGIDINWVPVLGPLTVDGFAGSDVDQNALGDCYFLASLGALANQSPDVLRRNLRDNGNGTVTVTFYRDGAPVEVTVSKDVPYAGDDTFPAFAGAANEAGDRETWVSLYEKAYASFHGSYGEIESGDTADALAEITGLPTDKWNPENHSPEELREKLDEGYALTVSTSREILWVLGKDPGSLVPNHAYTVVGVTSGGDVQLRNPWGDDAPTETLSWEEFQSSVYRLSLCPPE